MFFSNLINQEKWKEYRSEEFKNNEMLLVSNFGRVKKKNTQGDWYLVKFHEVNRLDAAYINKGKKSNYEYVHRLVAKLFCKQPSAKHGSVIHINYDKKDNHYKNLKWVTTSERYKHAQSSPNVPKVFNYKSKKLNDSTAKILKKKLLDPNRTTKVSTLATQFGISEKQARRVMRGECWAWVKI